MHNIGILAHVDAGKTTITENLLYLGGAIRNKGSVDSGSAITDSMSIEKERGISVRSAAVSFDWNGHKINLIDTPGHADFSAEVERVLRVLDGAVLVVSAVEGVQAHTFTIWEALKEMGIPTLIFVNKIDRAGADIEAVLKDIQQELRILPFAVHGAVDEGLNTADIVNLWTNKRDLSPDNIALKTMAVEAVAELDEEILEAYLNEATIEDSKILASATTLVKQKALVPVLAGIAKNAIGIEELLQGVIQFLPSAKEDKDAPLSAVVFKVEHHKTDGRLAHIRLFGGTLASRQSAYNYTQAKDSKVGLVQKMFTNKNEIIGELYAGDIGVVTGLGEVCAGDILGEPGDIRPARQLNIPVLTTQVKAVEDKDYAALAEALQFLNSEDPSLNFKWYKAEKEMHLQMMGPMQIEILTSILDTRFGIAATFEDPTVIYKETPIQAAEGYVRYWMPKPCWAIMTFLIEPGERGSGIVYESKIRTSDVHLKYQNEVERTVPQALEQGIKGWEVTDVKVTLIAGEDHEMHSRPGDFVLATPMGIMRGLENTGTQLLEPILDFEIKAPEEYLGAIAGELTRMRGQFGNPQFDDGRFVLKGKVPAATSMNYSIQLSSTTSGKGRIVFNFGGYDVCPEGEGKERPYKGVNPLDESQWILHRRGAYKADDRRAY